MFFGIGRNADLKWSNGPNTAHQFRGGLIAVGVRAIRLSRFWHIAAQGDDVPYACLPVIADYAVYGLARRAHAGEVRGRFKFGLVHYALHRGMRAVPR